MSNELAEMYKAGDFNAFLKAAKHNRCASLEAIKAAEKAARTAQDYATAAVLLHPKNGFKFVATSEETCTSFPKKGDFMCVETNDRGRHELFEVNYSMAIEFGPSNGQADKGISRFITDNVVDAIETLSGKTMLELIAQQAPNRPAPKTGKGAKPAAPAAALAS